MLHVMLTTPVSVGVKVFVLTVPFIGIVMLYFGMTHIDMQPPSGTLSSMVNSIGTPFLAVREFGYTPRSRETSMESFWVFGQTATAGSQGGVGTSVEFSTFAPTIPDAFGTTTNSEPRVIMPMLQLNGMDPVCVGVKVIVVIP